MEGDALLSQPSGHGGTRAPAQGRMRALQVLVAWTASFSVLVLVQLTVAVLASSKALLSQALHLTGDFVYYIVAVELERASERPPTFASPFGSARLQILGGLVGGILVLSSSFLVLLEAGVNMVAAPEAGAPRGCKPHPTPPPLGLVEAADFPVSASAPSPQPTAPSRPALVVATALVGSVANACGAVLLSASGSPHGHSHDHGHGHGGESSGRGSIARSMTVRGVVAHMATDAFSGATVAASALAQHTAFASYADLAACAAVVALSLYSTLPVLRDSARAALLTSPAGDGMRLAEQRRDLEDRILGCGGVSSVRQLRLLWIASDWVEALVEVGLEGGDEGRACDARVAECVREALLAAGMQEATVHVSEPPAGRGKRAA